MLGGIRGPLLTSDYLEHEVLAASADLDRSVDVRLVARLISDALDRFGPTTSARSIQDSFLMPVLVALGFTCRRDESPSSSARMILASGGCARLPAGALPWSSSLDSGWRSFARAALALGGSWAVLTNGRSWRVVDASRAYARLHAEFDLAVVCKDPRLLQIFCSLFHVGRFDAPPDRSDFGSCVQASRTHALTVCRSLKNGVLQASTAIFHGLLRPGGLHRPAKVNAAFPTAAYDQAVMLVYRVLFLFFAEARGLLPLWHPTYRDAYSVAALQDLIERPGVSPGLWESLQAMSRLVSTGCHAGDLCVTPFDGRLFARERSPLLDRTRIDDQLAHRALVALSTTDDARHGRQRVSFRDLGVEQIGAIYESLLEYQPRTVASPPSSVNSQESAVDSRQQSTVGGRQSSVIERGASVNTWARSTRHQARTKYQEPSAKHELENVPVVQVRGRRKATGTFYTPQAITDFLVRRTLHPLIAGKSSDEILALRIVDPAMGSGAFLVAAADYLARAYEQSLLTEGACESEDIDDGLRAHFRRLVAERCLYGVDRNPMAVQLATVSLWLATLAADKPLTFLDHHLKVGDSLVGASFDDLVRNPTERSRRHKVDPGQLPLFDADQLQEALGNTVPYRLLLAMEPSNDLVTVRAKERRLRRLEAPTSHMAPLRRFGDLWCAAWFWSGPLATPTGPLFRDLVSTIFRRPAALPADAVERYLSTSAAIASSWRFFHWPFEFPEVFFKTDGTPRTDGGFDAVLGNPPWNMVRADPMAQQADERAREQARSLLIFTRDSGVYRRQSDGQINSYQLFLERAIRLIRPRGRLGMVLPSGFALDAGSASLRRLVFEESETDAIVSMDNRAGLFPVHRSVRFLLLTVTTHAETSQIRYRSGESDAGTLDRIPDAGGDTSSFPVSLSLSLLRQLSGADLEIPDLRRTEDLRLAERMTRCWPRLGDAAGWGASFGRELNATEDRPFLLMSAPGLPVIEGKQLEPFVAHVGRARLWLAEEVATRLLPALPFRRARLAYRDVSSPTNRTTLIAAIIPEGCVTTHTLFCLKTPLAAEEQWFLCGMMNSYVANYYVRQRVSSHLTTALVERLPIPRPRRSDQLFQQISRLALHLHRSLTQTGDAKVSGRLRARIEGLVARLYGFSVEDFRYVLDSFPLVPSEEREAALEALAGCLSRNAGL